ncbi:5'(3')-deoxyribonucleotidase [Mucilaginibacter sp. L3T2-6]|uniref:5' nucleotidase, NT5C type n=1 Tax=Mucilaginibacter sp. L3T2-6 TaxID=3062491 RepID=UPI00267570C1|nr:5'(3')-deoxyribonucleotidase [Mucilaginibacter sp. L3T2-6]MDO3642166.1 5'(3')-deoxyribonucleotidase [Mucilaginibacter sp. L3T2-6]MDV6214661.1 5'(3')-deoxyribonucleotidase [Mucilaginibacter sp. L3T2-6]
MRKSIAIDMDGVIADEETQLLTWYERHYGLKIHPHELIGRTEYDVVPELGAYDKFSATPGYFRTTPVMPGAVEAVKKLSEDFDIYIVSAAMQYPLSLSQKLEWLGEHFPFISWRNIIFCGDKSIIGTDYMIDDHIKNLDNFKGKTVMFNAFHNVNHHHHQRVNNWDEVLELMKKEI